MLFIWEASKDRSNRRKHGVSFDTATRVFLDPLHLSRQDRIADGEERWQTIGTVDGVCSFWLPTPLFTRARKSFASSQHAGSPGRSESNMKKQAKSKVVVYELNSEQPRSARQKREMQALAAMPEDKIDTSDIPELPSGAWRNAVRGKWYRPVKQAVSIRLDADVLAWLKAKGDGYQTRVNNLLRERMLQEISK
jgi:uncharacterized protein (DUF4415 family)/uncharacterized DUF497 family protein